MWNEIRQNVKVKFDNELEMERGEKCQEKKERKNRWVIWSRAFEIPTASSVTIRESALINCPRSKTQVL